MLRVTLVLALVALASARTLQWKGCNTNFDDTTNWKSGAGYTNPASTTVPKEVYMTADPKNATADFSSVDSYVKGSFGMYELVLDPEGVILTLSAEGTELVFYQEGNTSDSNAAFIGGQPARLNQDDCNFQCHKGWRNMDNTPTNTPPCDGDVAIFPTPYSYRVEVPGVVNVDMVQFDGSNITKISDIPDYQITPTGNDLLLFLGNNANCLQDGLINATTGKCFCHSHCADAATSIANNAAIRDAAKAKAQADIAQGNTVSKRGFSYKLFMGSILNSMGGGKPVLTVQQDMDCALGPDQGNADNTRNTVVNYILQNIANSSFPDNDFMIDYLPSESSVVVRSQNFQYQTRTLPNFVSLVPSQTTEPMGNNLLMTHIFHVLFNTIQYCNVQAQQQKLDDYFNSQCDLGKNACNATKQIMSMATNTYKVIPDILDDIRNYTDNPATVSPNDPTMKPYMPSAAALSNIDPASRDVALTYIQMLYKAITPSGPNMTIPAATDAGRVLAVASGASTTADQLRGANLNSLAYPKLSLIPTKMTVTMLVGDRLPQQDVTLFAQDPVNRQRLINQIKTNFPGYPPLMRIEDVLVALAPKVNNRRRADPGAAGRAHTPLQVTITFTQLLRGDCVAGDTRMYCPLSPGSSLFTSLENILDSIVTLTPLGAGGSYPCSNQDLFSFNAQCVADKISASYCNLKTSGSTEAQLKEAVRSVVASTVYCGFLTCESGSGKDYYDHAVDQSYAILASKECATSGGDGNGGNGGSGGNSASASGGASGSSTGMIVGILVAVVAIAAIVAFVVMRRRKQGPSSVTKTDRNVVAFENPMYDEPNQGNANAPVYDMQLGAGVDDGAPEGLYDEPAFNAQKAAPRENPVYASTEDVAEAYDDADGEGGGYLDVAGQEEE